MSEEKRYIDWLDEDGFMIMGPIADVVMRRQDAGLPAVPWEPAAYELPCDDSHIRRVAPRSWRQGMSAWQLASEAGLSNLTERCAAAWLVLNCYRVDIASWLETLAEREHELLDGVDITPWLAEKGFDTDDDVLDQYLRVLGLPGLRAERPSPPAVVIPESARIVQFDEFSPAEAWDPTRIAREILHHLELAAHHFIAVGQRLVFAKANLQHGEWEAWVEKHLPFSSRQAHKYMQTANWVESHPRMAAPAAKLGLKRTLLLTTLPADQLDAVLCPPERGDIAEEWATRPYHELRDEVKRLRANAGDFNRSMAEEKEKAEKLRAENVSLRERLARKSGALPPESESKLVGELASLRTELDKVMAVIGPRLDMIAAQIPESSPLVRAHFEGLLQYMEVYTAHEGVRARDMAGLQVTGADYAHVLNRERPLAEVYELPRGRRVATFDAANG